MRELMFLNLHHAGLPTTDLKRAKAFWCDLLGMVVFEQKENWLGWEGKSYPIHLMPADQPLQGEGIARHIAIEVRTLEAILKVLLQAGLAPFQAALNGERRAIINMQQPLDFGIGTIFVHDPDGNVIEFVQRGRGIFSLLTQR